jgi:hypothetical protein
MAFLAPQIRNASRRASFLAHVSERDLYKQLLLHLPRLSVDDLADPQRLATEAERFAMMLLVDRRGFESWADQPKVPLLSKSSASVRACEPEIARKIHERFHYIRSYHPGCIHLALFLQSHPQVPAALASLSSLDIQHLDWLFASPEEKERVLVLTRLFAFDWAPRNSISYLLGHVGKWTKRNLPKVRALLTYINPNLGFTGSSFLAANWHPFLEKTVAYSYFEDTYITYRKLSSLPASALTQVTRSLYELEPLGIFRYEMSEDWAH